MVNYQPRQLSLNLPTFLQTIGSRSVYLLAIYQCYTLSLLAGKESRYIKLFHYVSSFYLQFNLVLLLFSFDIRIQVFIFIIFPLKYFQPVSKPSILSTIIVFNIHSQFIDPSYYPSNILLSSLFILFHPSIGLLSSLFILQLSFFHPYLSFNYPSFIFIYPSIILLSSLFILLLSLFILHLSFFLSFNYLFFILIYHLFILQLSSFHPY